MTINEMFNELENKVRDTYIVTLKYKYDFEENYTIENHILEYDSIADSYVWLNDWNEGQTDVEVLGYMILGEVDTTKLEPCEDCISREQTLKAFAEKCGGECACCEYNGSGYDTAENCKLIKSMPSVTPQHTRWIPVTERLPEIGQRILVTYNQEDEVKIDITYYTKHGFLLSVVIAWMPLSQPYKAESEDKK